MANAILVENGLVIVKDINMMQVTKKQAIEFLENYYQFSLKNPLKFFDVFFNNWNDCEGSMHEGYLNESLGKIELYHGSQFHSEIKYTFNK